MIGSELRWGPRPGGFVFGGVMVVAGLVWVIFASGAPDRVVGAALLLVALSGILVGLRLRDRLRASTTGLVIGTIKGKRTVSWAQVRRVEVVSSKRLGSTNHSLEIDLDNDDLLVFSRIDLGVDPTEVAEALTRLRTGTG